VQFIDRLYRFYLRVRLITLRRKIAAEKGPFPMFDAEKFLQSGYMQKDARDVRAEVREKGVRNVNIVDAGA